MMSTSRSKRCPAVSAMRGGMVPSGTRTKRRTANVKQHVPTKGPPAEDSVSDSNERQQVSFIAFIFSLASNAAVHFGDLPDPMTDQTRPLDLEAAAQLIEIIAMLEEKTRANPTAEDR